MAPVSTNSNRCRFEAVTIDYPIFEDRHMNVFPGYLYCGLHFWNWHELSEGVLSDSTWAYATTDKDRIIQVWEEENVPVWEDVTTIKTCATLLGCFYQLRFQFSAFEINLRALFSKYNLSSDGETHFEHDKFFDIYAELNTLFQNCIVSGKRFVDYSEGRILRHFGEASEQYAEWKKTTSYVYDHDLAYSFCYHARNCIEHEFPLINIVNVDHKNKIAGTAINLENDYINMNHKPTHKKQLEDFMRSRRQEGLSPWLSVGGTLIKYYGHLVCFYLLYLSFLDDETAEKIGEVEAFRKSRRANCLIQHIQSDDLPKSPLHRLYWIPTQGEHALIKCEMERFASILESGIEGMSSRLEQPIG